MDDDYAMARLVDGNLDMFTYLTVKYRPYLIRLISKYRIRDPEEVVQDTFMVLYKKAAQYRGKSLKSWLATIAIRRAIDVARKERRRPTIQIDGMPIAAKINPDHMELMETKQMVSAALQRMNPIYRDIISMHYLQGFDYPEIANMLTIPIGTVKSRLHAARKHFQDLILNA